MGWVFNYLVFFYLFYANFVLKLLLSCYLLSSLNEPPKEAKEKFLKEATTFPFLICK